MEAKVEKLAPRLDKERDYLPPPTVGTLADLDPAQLVTPPAGLEVGYVPIATRQAAGSRFGFPDPHGRFCSVGDQRARTRGSPGVREGPSLATHSSGALESLVRTRATSCRPGQGPIGPRLGTRAEGARRRR